MVWKDVVCANSKSLFFNYYLFKYITQSSISVIKVLHALHELAVATKTLNNFECTVWSLQLLKIKIKDE